MINETRFPNFLTKRRIWISVAFFFALSGGTWGYLFYPRFSATTGSQHAVFYTQLGAVGGGGDPVQLKPGFGTISVEGLPVYLKSDAVTQIRTRLPRQPAGTSTVLVNAKIQLEQTTVTISSPNLPRRQIYSVIIEQLYFAKWKY